jgi:hypothetical protein
MTEMRVPGKFQCIGHKVMFKLEVDFSVPVFICYSL